MSSVGRLNTQMFYVKLRRDKQTYMLFVCPSHTIGDVKSQLAAVLKVAPATLTVFGLDNKTRLADDMILGEGVERGTCFLFTQDGRHNA